MRVDEAIHWLARSGQALTGEARLTDETGGATYYHAEYAHPDWARGLVRTAQTGKHEFYRERVRPIDITGNLFGGSLR